MQWSKYFAMLSTVKKMTVGADETRAGLDLIYTLIQDSLNQFLIA